MNYKEPTTETEILSMDEQKIHEMCISLKKFDAPKDFDFKLKARIAKAKPSDFQPRFGFAFRSALSALAMIFVLGFLAYTGGIFSSSKNNAPMAESSPPTKDTSLPQNTVASTSSSGEENENSIISPTTQQTPNNFEEHQTAENNPQKSKKVIDKVKKSSFKGSKDLALTVEKIKQPNINSNVAPQNPTIVEKMISHPVKEILAQFGINAVFENGKWIVKSVIQNGVAESSGIKENDIVEAIDNQMVSAEPISAKTLNFKNITVMRNGGKLEIKLLNKQ